MAIRSNELTHSRHMIFKKLRYVIVSADFSEDDLAVCEINTRFLLLRDAQTIFVLRPPSQCNDASSRMGMITNPCLYRVGLELGKVLVVSVVEHCRRIHRYRVGRAVARSSRRVMGKHGIIISV